MEITIEEAERRLASLCGSLNVLHGQLVGLVVEVVDSGAWAVSGVRTVEQWLSWQAGLAPATARHLVSLATATATHPKVSALLADGAISLDQATAAVAAPGHCDDVMADLAPLSTVRQIRVEARVANTTVPDQEPSAGVDVPAPATDLVTQYFDEHGRYVLHAELDGERGRIVEAALAEAHDRRFRDGDGDVSRADALVDVATRSLAQCPVGRLELFRINVFAESGGPVTWMDGAALPDAVRRHLACDGSWTPVVTDGGHPVSVGRSQRIVPERTRRLVEHRDRGACRVPWCDSRHGLQIHHVRHWEEGGATDTPNLVTLCASCHRHHHRGRLDIAGDADEPDGLTFTRAPAGDVQRIRPTPPNGPPPVPANRYRHPLGERLNRWALVGVFPQPAAG